MAKREMPEKKTEKKPKPPPARKKKTPTTYFGLKKISYKSPKV
jgi:hypothetical protein